MGTADKIRTYDIVHTVALVTCLILIITGALLIALESNVAGCVVFGLGILSAVISGLAQLYSRILMDNMEQDKPIKFKKISDIWKRAQ